MYKIKIPVFDTNSDLVTEINDSIIELIPSINKYKKDLSLEWTERLLIYFDYIAKNVSYNELQSLEDRPLQGSVKYVQIPQSYRHVILRRKDDSIYHERIVNNILSKYVDVRMHYDPTHGLVEMYSKGKACKYYYFKNKPVDYQDYYLSTPKGIRAFESLKGLKLTSKLLTSEEQEVRRSIIYNTDKIILLDTIKSNAVLEQQLKEVKLSTKQFLINFNEDGSRMVICDDWGRRCHHKLTSLKNALHSEIRVKYNNKLYHTVGIDLKNSQPYFLSILIGTNLIQTLIVKHKNLKYLTKLEPIIQKYKCCHDVMKFGVLAQKGMLYEFLMEQYENLFSQKTTREEIKSVNFLAMYSDYSKHSSNYYKQRDRKQQVEVLKDSFPNLYSMIAEIQKVDLKQKALMDKDNIQESHKNLPFILQQVESTICLDIICKRIFDYNKNHNKSLFYSTVHDSLVTIPQHLDEIKNIITDSFNSLNIPCPALKIK